MKSNNELSIKLNRIRRMLKEENLDACYIKRQDNFCWLTCGAVNFIGMGDMGNVGLLVTEDQTYAITNNVEAPRMLEEEALEELGFEILYDSWYKDDFESNKIKEICGEGRVGFDHHNQLGINISGKIQPLRYSLTEEEVEKYKIGGRLFSWALEETIAAVEPGDTEIEVAGRLNHALRKKGLLEATLMCASDERIYKYKHPIPTKKLIKERVQLGANVRYKGLNICATRYVNFIPITEELKEQHKKNVEIDCILIHNTIPGKSYQDPFQAGKKAYEDFGYAGDFEKHHIGGPTGYTARDFRIGFNHDGKIEVNQAFCWNPSITGTKSEDTIIATEEGPIFVSNAAFFPTVSVEIDGKAYERPNILEKLL